jgi:hypothetical protein
MDRPSEIMVEKLAQVNYFISKQPGVNFTAETRAHAEGRRLHMENVLSGSLSG